MATAFPLLLEEASTIARGVDLLFAGLTAVTLLFSFLIFFFIVFFAVKYRRGNKVDRSNPPEYNGPIEFIWTVVPGLMLLGIFLWSTLLYFDGQRVPKGAMEIQVVGKQWMWKLQHPEGRWEMDELHVPVGRPVFLTMTSEDVIHSFFIPAFRVKQDVVPGRYTHLWFQATRVGSYHLFCAQFCGTDHSQMIGTVTVMEPADYERWLANGSYQGSLAQAGERLFMRAGCSGCHGVSSNVRAPLLDGIYGKPVAIQVPRTGVPLQKIPAISVIADERYLHDCIMQPETQVVAGFEPLMPTFKGRLTEEQVLELITYIKSLGTSNGTSNGGSKGSGGEDYTGPMTPEDVQVRTGFVPKNMKTIAGAAANGPVPAAGAAGAGTAGATERTKR